MMPMDNALTSNLKAGMMPIMQPTWISDKKWAILMYYWWAARLDYLGRITEAAEGEHVEVVEEWASRRPADPLTWCERQFILLDKCGMI